MDQTGNFIQMVNFTYLINKLYETMYKYNLIAN